MLGITMLDTLGRCGTCEGGSVSKRAVLSGTGLRGRDIGMPPQIL